MFVLPIMTQFVVLMVTLTAIGVKWIRSDVGITHNWLELMQENAHNNHVRSCAPVICVIRSNKLGLIQSDDYRIKDSPSSTTQINMDVPIHYQTIFRQPNKNFHRLFSFSYIIFKLTHVSKKIFTIKQICQDYSRRLQENFPAPKIKESPNLFTSFTAWHHAQVLAYYLDTRAREYARLFWRSCSIRGRSSHPLLTSVPSIMAW